MDDLIEAACKAFASHYHYLLKAQNFHWNIKGEDFIQYHKLFGNIYRDLEKETDEFAEQIRALQAEVPAGFKYFQEYTNLADPEKGMVKDDMLFTLYRDNAAIVNALLDAYEKAEEYKEHGFGSFLAERLAKHRKYGWMLYSSMKL